VQIYFFLQSIENKALKLRVTSYLRLLKHSVRLCIEYLVPNVAISVDFAFMLAIFAGVKFS
jgi:hypothetical protein